jgi:RNA polymerase sigma-70 factor (ECF subfamily)
MTAPREPRAFQATEEETDLVGRLRRREEAAFLEVVERHHAGLVRVARRRLGDEAAAEEVVQEAWIALLRGIDSFEGRPTLRTWLYRVVTNLALTRRARGGREIPFSEFAREEEERDEPAVDPSRFHRLPFVRDEWKSSPPDWGRSAEDLVVAAETRAFILDTVASLPAAQQEVIRLRDIEGYSSEEVCELLGITAGNQRVLLHRARSKVRAALEGYLTGRD